MKLRLGILLSVGIVCVLAGRAGADTLVTKEGRSFQGRLLKRDSAQVVFEIHQYGAVLTRTFKASEVQSITEGPLQGPKTRPAPTSKPTDAALAPEPKAPPIVKYDKPTYYVIPFEGTIGTHITAAYFERSLKDAEKRKADVIVIVADSPGGLVAEVEKLVAVFQKHNKRMRIVVYVRQALSACAIACMSSKEIYFEPRGILGAATAYKRNALNMPEAIAEKFQSVWRAIARSAAEVGGHNPLLAEAMIDRNMELSVVRLGKGKVEVRSGHGGRSITTKGKLLTLTASEAVKAGLAKGTAANLADLGEKLGFKGWTECKGHAALLSKHAKKALAGYEKRVEQLTIEFNRCVARALKSHPDKPQVKYKYYIHNGLFTPESRRRWKNRTRECVTWLVKAEKSLEEMAKLATVRKDQQTSVDMLNKVRDAVRSERLEFARKMYKRGPDD